MIQEIITASGVGLPALGLDEQIKLELLNLAKKDPDSLELELALKDIQKHTKLGIRALRNEYASQKRKLELENIPPPAELSPEELAAAAAVRQNEEKRQKELESAAEALANSPDIFGEFEHDFCKTGYIADKNLSRSLLISHGARLLPISTAFMLVGASGSGKSDAISKASAFLPQEFVRTITSASEQSFYYLGDVKHQYLMFGEMHPIKDERDDYRQTAIRQLISENRLTRLVVEKADGHTNTAVEKLTDGPCVLIASTTTEQGAWNDEFANRMSWLRSNDSEETTFKVLDLQSSIAQEPWKSNDNESVTKRWQVFHRQLRALGVTIPFAKMCAPQSRHVTVRRLFALLLTYVKVSALLHQATRKIVQHNGRDFVVANDQDYRVAYELLTENAPRVLDLCSGPAMKALKVLQTKWTAANGTNTEDDLTDKEEVFLTTGQIQQILKEPSSTVRRWLLDLTNAGFLNAFGKSGRQNLYGLGVEANICHDLGLVPPQQIHLGAKFDEQ